MYQSILVPLDGTPFAEAALPTAIRLARACPASLTLVRVIERSAPSSFAGSADDHVEWRNTPADRSAYYLENLAVRIQARSGVNARTIVLRGGIASSIRKQAEESDCDLIVMTSRGHGATGRIFQSSVGSKVTRSAPCPVLFIRHMDASLDWSVHRRFMHVMVPLDGSRAAEAALPMAMTLSRLDEARLTLFHVAQPQLVAAASASAPLFSARPDIALEEVERMTRDYLQSLVERVQQEHASPFTAVHIEDGAPAPAILEYANRSGVDLIAMTTHGYTGLRKFVLGSVAASVLRRTNAAVLLLPPNAAR